MILAYLHSETSNTSRIDRVSSSLLIKPKNLTRVLCGISTCEMAYKTMETSLLWKKYTGMKFEDVFEVAKEALEDLPEFTDSKRIKLSENI